MPITLGGIDLTDLWFDPATEMDLPGSSKMVVSRAGTPLISETAALFKIADLVGDADSGWITWATLNQLRALAAVPNAEYTLEKDGETFTAAFRNWEGQAVAALPVIPGQPPEDGDFFHSLRLKLIMSI